jgi:methylenetetrahydrofolate dehydrogenase (NADP+)/methenyltetrahydrofolate cyclohydrolase
MRRQALAAERIGLRYSIEQVAPEADESTVIRAVAKLNADPGVSGIIVQLPLPRGVAVETVQAAIDPAKDVEGVHPANLGALLGERPSLVPCTAAAVMACLDATGRTIAGMDAVVVGRSRIVGRPVALLLVQRNATVTVCHRQTRDAAAHLRRADLVVMAAGQAGLLAPDMVRPGGVVIDVGTNEVVRDGKRTMAGDADPAVAEVAGWFTPTPGGVGPVTVAILWRNAVAAWEKRLR